MGYSNKDNHLQLCGFIEQQHSWDLASVIPMYESQSCWCSIDTKS